MYNSFIELVRDIYQSNELIPLHEPKFIGKEKENILEAIDSTFVSTNVGTYVSMFENLISDFTGSKFAVSTVNGTSALHTSLLVNDIKKGHEVITQSLTFISTCNAISYVGAVPVFVDVSKETLGLCPKALETFIEENCFIDDKERLINKNTKKIISACIPMHTFGFPSDISTISKICKKYHLILIEDAAESLGSFQNKIHTGTFGNSSILSFNGNKVITTGGGGMILTNNESIAIKAKHLTTQARKIHKWNFDHDMIGYNYRLPNINAAIGCGQVETLSQLLEAKRKIASRYFHWGQQNNVKFIEESNNSKANYWLNTLLADTKDQRDEFLEKTNAENIMTRPSWKPMHKLEMFKNCQKDELKNTNWLADRLVNVPSTPIL